MDICKELGLDVRGIELEEQTQLKTTQPTDEKSSDRTVRKDSPQEIVNEFGRKENIPDYVLETGLWVLEQ